MTELLAFLGGILTGWTLKVVVDRSKKNTSVQIANKSGGDIAGRDIKK